MSEKPADAAPAPPKSKKMLLIVGVVLLVLALAGAGGWFYVSKQRAAALDGDEEEVATKVHAKGPPTYLPLDNMVVNLADPGGEKVVQVGIILELNDAKAVEKVKLYLPTIRSGILLLVSQRTSEELLQREGKEKLATDILIEAAKPFGVVPHMASADAEKKPTAGAKAKAAKKPEKAPDELPVTRVLFSSFIVQ